MRSHTSQCTSFPFIRTGISRFPLYVFFFVIPSTCNIFIFIYDSSYNQTILISIISQPTIIVKGILTIVAMYDSR